MVWSLAVALTSNFNGTGNDGVSLWLPTVPKLQLSSFEFDFTFDFFEEREEEEDEDDEDEEEPLLLLP
jgi:hypothetical protein